MDLDPGVELLGVGELLGEQGAAVHQLGDVGKAEDVVGLVGVREEGVPGGGEGAVGGAPEGVVDGDGALDDAECSTHAVVVLEVLDLRVLDDVAPVLPLPPRLEVEDKLEDDSLGQRMTAPSRLLLTSIGGRASNFPLSDLGRGSLASCRR